MAGCTPNCGDVVGDWRTEFNGEALRFIVRADYSLTTTASGEISGGSWKCLASNKVLLEDKKTPAVNAELADINILRLPKTAGLPEILLKRAPN
jgi:hypothetical protein